MHRNATSIGLATLLLGLLGTNALVWSGSSVPKDALPATAHTAAVRRAHQHKRAAIVPSARKVRRSLLTATTIIPPLPIPQPAPTILPIVDQPTITDNHQKIASAVLNALPAGCRDNLQTFAVLYRGATRRGLGGKTTIILDGSVPDEEFVALLVHECGHVIHGNMHGTATAGQTAFTDGPYPFYADSPMIAFWNISWKNSSVRLPAARDADFVSGYAKSDPFEDFSETFAAYVLQRDALRERAKTNNAIAAKLFWMDVNLPMAENTIGDGTATWEGTVPWDMTKLPLTLVTR